MSEPTCFEADVKPVRGRSVADEAARVSAELYSIPLERDRYIIYAPLRRAAFVANAATVILLADLKAGRCGPTGDDALLEFLRGIEMLDAGPDPLPITAFRGKPRPTSVTLFLTTACNLRCTYCYASAGDTQVEHMPLDVAKRGIDFVVANARARRKSGIEIACHGGGEPTLNWTTRSRALAYARQQGTANSLAVHASLATNGMLSDSHLDWVLRNIDDISLSFDGLPAAHDRHRITSAGGGSSARVIHTLRRLDQAGFPYGLRVTVTADQIEQLPDSVEYICRNFKVRDMLVEPVYRLGRWREKASAETGSFISAFRSAQRRAGQFGREIHFSGARVGLLTNHFCGASQDGFSLSPAGGVSACYESFSERLPHSEVFFYGRPKTNGPGYEFDVPVLEHLRHQGVQHRRFCQGCYAKWSCGGDCYYRARTATGDGEFAGTDRCHITRELTKDQILGRIVKAGGLFWHEPPPDPNNTTTRELPAHDRGNVQ